jgi:MarR family transcriptional regulator for hemolysin
VEDRRAKKIVLCPPAKPLIEQIETIANALRVELFSGVDEADLEVCMRVHAKILGNLESPESQPSRASPLPQSGHCVERACPRC